MSAVDQLRKSVVMRAGDTGKFDYYVPENVATQLAAALDLRDAEIKRLRDVIMAMDFQHSDTPLFLRLQGHHTLADALECSLSKCREALAPNQPAAGKETGKC